VSITRQHVGPDLRFANGRAEIVDCLIDYGLTAHEADQWCRAWEARAYAENRHPRSSDYWRGATVWILTQIDPDIFEADPRRQVNRNLASLR
jgi:hypothetical protein